MFVVGGVGVVVVVVAVWWWRLLLRAWLCVLVAVVVVVCDVVGRGAGRFGCVVVTAGLVAFAVAIVDDGGGCGCLVGVVVVDGVDGVVYGGCVVGWVGVGCPCCWCFDVFTNAFV